MGGFVIGTRVGGLLISIVLALPAVAQRATPQHPPAQKQTHPNANKNNQGQNHPPNNKPGVWLQQHKNLPPEQQQKALEPDPNFQKLPPERQEHLTEELRRFHGLPPEQPERAIQRR